MMADAMLYEVCPACEGTGVIHDVTKGSVFFENLPCPTCCRLNVVPVGVTCRQLERMVAREAEGRNEAEGRKRADV
jgi:hypothetical protein